MSCQGAELTRRTFSEWCDYIFYIPAALDGQISLVLPELRDDLCAVVQLLLVIVVCARQRRPYTVPEGHKVWTEGVITMYRHIDRIAMIISRHEAAEDRDDDGVQGGLGGVLRRLEQHEAATWRAHDGYVDSDDDDEAAAGENAGRRRGFCLGPHAVGPCDVEHKHKPHLVSM